MTVRTWLRTLFTPKFGPRPARPRTRPRARLILERLEDRLAPATLTVTSSIDDPTLAQDSLRAAIASIEHGADQNANIQRTGVYGSNDTIQFNLPAGQRTITLTSSDPNQAFGPTALVITKDMTIDGAQGGVTLSGNNAQRLFAVVRTASLTLQDVTLTGGLAQGGNGGNSGQAGAGGGGAGLGGAIFNQGTLALVGCTLTANTAQGGAGGHSTRVEATSPPTLDPTSGSGGGPNGGAADGGNGGFGGGGGGGVLFSGPGGAGGFGGGGGGSGVTGDASAAPGAAGFGGGGGGIGFEGFDYEGGAGGGGAGLGGAVFNDGGSVAITNSTLSGNTALGGAGYHHSPGGVENSGDGSGLGGAVFSRNGTLTIVNSTLSSNTAGSVYVLGDGDTATATLNNSLLGQADGGALDFDQASINGGTVTTSGSNNLISAQSGFTGGFLSFFPSPSQVFSDPGFEVPAVGPASIAYLPTGSPWTFTGGSGLASNGSGFGNPPAPEGSQVAFLQGSDSSISQTVDLAAGSYALTLLAAQRPGNQQSFEVKVDDAVVATFTPSGSRFALYVTSNFAVTAGSHTIQLVGLNPQGGDNTAFLDQISITQPIPVLGPLQDNGGPTQTMALLPGSPAIDAGSNALVPAGATTDQRGAGRIFNGTVDIGAYERQATPTITWAAPAAIAIGTALSAAQLDATADVPGTFTYTPAAGTVLDLGTQTLSVLFTPTDRLHSETGTASVTLSVDRPTAVLTLASSANPAVFAQPVTFTATVGAPGAAPTGTVTFSDGGTALATVPVVNGQARYTTAALARGSHSITARYSGDGSYNASTSAALTEAVQAVASEPDPLDPTRTALVVGGTDGNDLIVITPGPRPGTAQVFIQQVRPAGPSSVQTVSLQGVSRLLVYGGRGDDTLAVDPSLALPALLDGGPGNDHLVAGAGPSVLVGGDGNDTLLGGPGRSLLIGGAGADVVRGGGGQAVLVGGTTDYDGDAAALGRLLREWARPDLGYAARVSHLLYGGGLNGSAVLGAATAHDDGAVDQLFGGSDLDLDVFGAGDLLAKERGTAVQV